MKAGLGFFENSSLPTSSTRKCLKVCLSICHTDFSATKTDIYKRFFVQDTVTNIDKSQLKNFRKFVVAELQYLKWSEIGSLKSESFTIYISLQQRQTLTSQFLYYILSHTFFSFVRSYNFLVPILHLFVSKNSCFAPNDEYAASHSGALNFFSEKSVSSKNEIYLKI